MVFASSASLLLRYMYIRANRQKELMVAATQGSAAGTAAATGEDEKHAEAEEAGHGDRFLEDRTDKQRETFRYTY